MLRNTAEYTTGYRISPVAYRVPRLEAMVGARSEIGATVYDSIGESELIAWSACRPQPVSEETNNRENERVKRASHHGRRKSGKRTKDLTMSHLPFSLSSESHNIHSRQYNRSFNIAHRIFVLSSYSHIHSDKLQNTTKYYSYEQVDMYDMIHSRTAHTCECETAVVFLHPQANLILINFFTIVCPRQNDGFMPAAECYRAQPGIQQSRYAFSKRKHRLACRRVALVCMFTAAVVQLMYLSTPGTAASSTT